MEGGDNRLDSGFGGETSLHSMDDKEEEIPDPGNEDYEKYYDACDNLKGEMSGDEVPTQYEENSRRPTIIVLVGKTGNGKSATANTISGQKNLFPEARRMKSVTKNCQREEVNVAGCDLVLVDTPGNFDTENKHQALVEIGHAIHLEPNGYDAILVVLRIDVRLTNEEKKAIKELRQVFGSEMFMHYAIVIFTRGDQFEDEDGQSFLESIRSEGDDFMNSFLDECKNRCILFNNKLQETSHEQVEELLNMAQKLRQNNGDKRYTNHHFQDAKQHKEAFDQFKREKRLALQQQINEFEDQKRRRDKAFCETEMTLKEEPERQIQFQIQEEKVRLRDKWNRQMENERQKYVRNLKMEIHKAESNTTIHVDQVTFDGAFVDNELKNTLGEYLSTTEEAWQKMVESEVDQYKSKLDIICRRSNVEDISEAVDDSVDQFRKTVHDLKNKSYVLCDKKLKGALDQQKHVMKYLKTKRREEFSTKLKKAVTEIERDGLGYIDRDFDEIKTIGFKSIQTYTVSTKTMLNKEIQTMEKMIWNETQIELYAKMNPLFDQVRNDLQTMTRGIVSFWEDKTVRKLLQKTTQELLQSFETISLEIKSQFETEIRVAKVSAEKSFHDAVVKVKTTRELTDIEKSLEDEIQRQGSMLMEFLLQAVPLSDELVEPCGHHNQVENDCTNETDSLKAVADKLRQDQQKECVANIEKTILTVTHTFENVRKEQQSKSKAKWDAYAEDERKERKHAFERKVNEIITATKKEIVSKVEKNVKASGKIKTEIMEKLNSFEKAWKQEITTLIKEKEREWKEKQHGQCLPESLFNTCFYHIESSAVRKLEQKLFSLQKSLEEEWNTYYTDRLHAYVMQLESEHKRILLSLWTSLDERGKRVLKDERERYQERSQEVIGTKENYWTEVVKEQKLLFLQRVTDEMGTEKADTRDYKREWKETINRKRKYFELDCMKGIKDMKREAEEHWQIMFDKLKREYKANAASQMAIFVKQLPVKSKLKKKRGNVEEKWKQVISEQTDLMKNELINDLIKSADVCMTPYQMLLEDQRKSFEEELEIEIRKHRESKDKVDYDEICKMACGKTLADRIKLCFCPESYIIDSSFCKRKLKHVDCDTFVLCYSPEGSFCFSRIYRFGHRESVEENVFVKIRTKSKEFMASPNHHIHVGAIVDYKHTKSAFEIQPGDTVFVCQDMKLMRETVLSVFMTRNKGLCAPYTHVGTIIVDGVLASCYVDRVKPFLAHRLLAPVRLLHKLLPGRVQTFDIKSLPPAIKEE